MSSVNHDVLLQSLARHPGILRSIPGFQPLPTPHLLPSFNQSSMTFNDSSSPSSTASSRLSSSELLFSENLIDNQDVSDKKASSFRIDDILNRNLSPGTEKANETFHTLNPKQSSSPDSDRKNTMKSEPHPNILHKSEESETVFPKSSKYSEQDLQFGVSAILSSSLSKNFGGKTCHKGMS